MSYLKKGLIGFGAIFAFSVLGNVLGYITRAVLSREVSPEQFGLFFSVNALVMVLGIVTFGWTTSLIKHIAQFNSKGEQEKAKFALVVSAGSKMALTLVISIALYLCAELLATQYFKVPEAAGVVRILAIGLLMFNFAKVVKGILNGMQAQVIFGSAQFVQPALILTAIVALFFSKLFPNGAATIAIAYTIGWALTAAIYLLPAIRYSHFFSTKMSGSKKLAKQVTRFGLFATMTFMTSSLITYIDTMMLTAMKTLQDVAIYNAAIPTVMGLTIVGSSLNRAFLPMSSEMWTKKENKRLAHGFERMITYVILLMTPLSMIMISFPKDVLKTLYTAEYTGGALAMQIFAAAIIFSTIFKVITALIKGMGRPETITKIVSVTCGINIILNYFFIKTWGVNGAATATTISIIFMGLWGYKEAKKALDLHLPWKTIVVSAGGAILFFVIAQSAKLIPLHYLAADIIGGVVATLAFYGICLVTGVMTKNEVGLFVKTVLNKK